MSANIRSYVSGGKIGFLWGDLNMASLAAQDRLTSFLAWQNWLAREAVAVYSLSSTLDPTSADVNPTSAHVGSLGFIKPGLL